MNIKFPLVKKKSYICLSQASEIDEETGGDGVDGKWIDKFCNHFLKLNITMGRQNFMH